MILGGDEMSRKIERGKGLDCYYIFSFFSFFLRGVFGRKWKGGRNHVFFFRS